MRGWARPTAVALLAAALGVGGLAGCASDDDAADGDAGDATTTIATGSTTSPSDDDESTTTEVGAPTPAGSIADVDFRNTTLQYPSAAGDDEGLSTATVVDGEYSEGESQDNFLFLEVADVDLADLDGDGAEEAAVTISYNTGGSGQFTDVLIYRWSPEFPNTEFVTSDGVGDRGDGGVDDVGVVPAGGVEGEVLVVRRNTDAEGACCPTALEERMLRLRDDELVQIGDADKWGIVRVGVTGDGEPTSEPTVVKFLPGASRADLTGDATTPVAASFEANAGQTLTLTLDPQVVADNPVVMVVSGPDGVGGRVGTDLDTTLSLTLPSSGVYRIQIDAVGTVDESLGRYFDADLRVE